MGINLINDNLVAANARALFARANNSASVAVGAYLPCFLTANSRSYNEGGGFRSTGVGVDGAEEIEVLFDGTIEVSGIFNFLGSGHATLRLDMIINGTYHSIISFAKSNLQSPTGVISGSAKVQRGDLIRFQNQCTGAVTIDDNGRYTVSRVSDYSAGQPAGFGLATVTKPGIVKSSSGTWTPTTDSTLGTVGTITYPADGFYIQIGDIVQGSLILATTGWDEGGRVRVNLPIAPDVVFSGSLRASGIGEADISVPVGTFIAVSHSGTNALDIHNQYPGTTIGNVYINFMYRLR